MKINQTFIFFLVLLFCITTFGADAGPVALDPIFDPPWWLKASLLFIKHVPVIGNYLVLTAQYCGVLGTVMTALSVFLMAISKSLEQVSRLSFIGPKLLIVKALVDKAIPYVKFLSIFNVQKDELQRAS